MLVEKWEHTMIVNKRTGCVAAVLALTFAQWFAQGQSNAVPQLQKHPTGERSILLPPGEVYRLQAGDTVTVSFRFTPEFNDEAVIGPDGHVSLKATGDIRVAGLSIAEAQNAIAKSSSSKLVDPEVTISLKEFDRPHVTVSGEVLTPGRYELRKPTTALQAVLMAGGPKEDGAMGRVLLFRKLNSEMAEVHVLQLGKYRSKNRTSQDMMLQPDDMILVRHDNLSKVERYVKIINLGVYFNPLSDAIF
jgi:polysaccharide biosynthesis/export protein